MFDSRLVSTWYANCRYWGSGVLWVWNTTSFEGYGGARLRSPGSFVTVLRVQLCILFSSSPSITRLSSVAQCQAPTQLNFFATMQDMMEISSFTLDSPCAIAVARKTCVLHEPSFFPIHGKVLPEFYSFPDEVLVRIFSYLGGKDVRVTIPLICKRFKALSTDDYLW